MRSMTAREDAAEIRAALPGLRRGSGLPVVFGGAVQATGRAHYTELSGADTDVLRGLVIDPGRGLGGKSLTELRPLWVPDYLAARQISHEYDGPVRAERLKALVAAPVVVAGRPRGVLLGGLRRSVPLGERTVAAFAAAARDAGQRIAVRDAARRRAAEVEQARAAAAASGPAAPHWAEVRALNAELRAAAAEVDDPDLRERLLDVCTRMDAAASPPPAAGAPRLAPRELDVLTCTALGCTNADTAARLNLRPETVKSYLRSAMRRLGAHTRTEAVAEARRHGLLP